MIEPIFAFGAVLLGAILGSFLNAVTFRYNTGGSLWRVMQGRSHCMRCNHTLGALDLVPIISWMTLAGRCRYCRAPISVQYPLVEIAAAALSLAVYAFFPQPLGYAFWLLFWLVALFLVIYDWRHMILPIDALVLLGVLGLTSLFFSCNSGVCVLAAPDTSHIMAGFLMALPLAFLSLISRGRWMGWGDGIFALPLGFVLGLMGSVTALLLAFWIGAIVGIALLAVARLFSRRLTLQSQIPFGPFLALGAGIVFFLHPNLLAFLGWY